MTQNPFFEAWHAPFELPPFDRIRPEHFPPAFDRGMAEHGAETAAIAGSSAPPDFANTVEALERSGRMLRRVSRVFSNLTSSATNEALDAIDRDYAPRLAAHRIKIMLDPALFAHRHAVAGPRPARSRADQLRLLDRHHLQLVRAGARSAWRRRRAWPRFPHASRACTRWRSNMP
jgi:peptidyl-dipeptidase Dcp